MIKRISLFLLLAAAIVLAACPEAHGHRGRELTIHRLDHGVFYGAAPKSDADFARLRRLGVRRVIDVRTFKVVAGCLERRRAAKYGITYDRIPSGFLPTRTGNVPRIMSQLTSADCGAVYFHCNLGSDRTGMLAAIYRTEHLGWNPLEAFTTWKAQQFNTNLKDLDRYFWQHVKSGNDVR